RLVRGGSIRGRVVDQHGNPLGHVAVQAIPKPLSGPLRQDQGGPQTFSNMTGAYRLSGLAPGEYAIVAMGRVLGPVQPLQVTAFFPDASRPQFFRIVSGNEFRNVDFSMHALPGSRIRGRLNLAGTAPGTRFFLSLVLQEQPGFTVRARLAEDDG